MTPTPPRILLAGGGSAGHVSPLLATAAQIRRRSPESEIIVLGTAQGLETDLVPAAGLELVTIDEQGLLEVVRLGKDLTAGERPQHVVRAGVWQAARPLGAEATLCGCTVAPGFDFADFRMPPRSDLIALFPEHQALITALTR